MSIPDGCDVARTYVYEEVESEGREISKGDLQGEEGGAERAIE